MNIKEAYNVVGLSESSSDEELKSKYKKLAVEFHPDKYKEDPDKFKKINEAYQLIRDHRDHPEKYKQPPFGRVDWSPGSGNFTSFDDIFSHINSQYGHFNQDQQPGKIYNASPVQVNVDITFKECVTGVNKEISYKKSTKCDKCNGKGTQSIPNGCQSCNGFGRIVSNGNGMVFTRVCSKCYGKNIKFNNCGACETKGFVDTDVNVNVHIPAGNSSVLRLRGAGNYVGTQIFGDAYTDVFVRVNVQPDPDLTLDGTNVVSHLKLSLLDALTGCSCEVRTIHDKKKINIPAMSKNKDEIHLTGCGIKQANGIQRVILNIEYPKDSEKLISYLKKME